METLGQNVFHLQNTSHTSVFTDCLSWAHPGLVRRVLDCGAGSLHWQTPSGAGAWVCPGVHGTLGATGEAASWALGPLPSQSAG